MSAIELQDRERRNGHSCRLNPLTSQTGIAFRTRGDPDPLKSPVMSSLWSRIPVLGPILTVIANVAIRIATFIIATCSGTHLAVLLYAFLHRSSSIADAVISQAGYLSAIANGIASNDLNAATLGLIWRGRSALARFLVDLVECAKCYAPATSLDGRTEGPHGRDNELDLTQAMCRHAVVCQAQRLAKSLIVILGNAMGKTRFEDIDMTKETQLETDDYGDVQGKGVVIEVSPSGRQRVVHPRANRPWLGEDMLNLDGNEPEDSVHDEKWFFVNGIATELFWLHLACKKLAEHFKRDITGVFNRSEGILWDLIECAGERNIEGEAKADSQNDMVKRTRSSKMAQKSLKKQVEAALKDAKEKDRYKRIVVVAHSQGCLVLRLALQDLAKVPSLREIMRSRLCVFTFGNPSVEWNDTGVLHTEHFANEKDFVAQLGVIGKHTANEVRGYDRRFVFVNKSWTGHLFGTQYSLDPRDYRHSGSSWLLGCKNGASLEGQSVPPQHFLMALTYPFCRAVKYVECRK